MLLTSSYRLGLCCRTGSTKASYFVNEWLSGTTLAEVFFCVTYESSFIGFCCTSKCMMCSWYVMLGFVCM